MGGVLGGAAAGLGESGKMAKIAAVGLDGVFGRPLRRQLVEKRFYMEGSRRPGTGFPGTAAGVHRPAANAASTAMARASSSNPAASRLIKA